MINYEFFPKNIELPHSLKVVVDIFILNSAAIETPIRGLSSNDVLCELEKDLISNGYLVEKQIDGTTVKVSMPVLFGRNGKKDKEFQVDAYHKIDKTVVEVEAGQGVVNYKFLKDFF